MLVLVINSGSSSLKFKLLEMPEKKLLCSGLIERIGEVEGVCTLQSESGNLKHALPIKGHTEALQLLFALLDEHVLSALSAQVEVVAHRVVHGGEFFSQAVEITDDVLDKIEACIPLAPLHNPANLLGIKAVLQTYGTLKQIAVFDTAFHQSMPAKAYTYALSEALRQRVRRYGFHGSSHAYIANAAAQVLDKPLNDLNIISLHLGNGASACAISAGKSVDTSMGFTPLEGLVMGTRAGDLDPGVLLYLQHSEGYTLAEIDTLLNKHSGLKGLCGESDMRMIIDEAEHDPAYALALDVFVYRIKKYIGAYMAVLGRVDAIVFTGGIGENASKVRQAVCLGMEPLGIECSPSKNAQSQVMFHEHHSKIKLLCIKTDEEAYIAEQAFAFLQEV